MDATLFQFTMTMPGDHRLAEVVRDLTAHAAKYAQLAEPEARALVAQVGAALAVSSSAAANCLVQVHYERTPQRLDVAIEWDGAAPAAPDTGRSDASPVVHWSRHGTRQRCLVSHIAST